MSTVGAQTAIFWPWFEQSGESLSFVLSSAQIHYGYAYSTTHSIGNTLRYPTNPDGASEDACWRGSKLTIRCGHAGLIR